jgi:hypothetical protein
MRLLVNAAAVCCASLSVVMQGGSVSDSAPSKRDHSRLDDGQW